MAGRGSFSISGDAQRRWAYRGQLSSSSMESCGQRWGRLRSPIPTGSMWVGAESALDSGPSPPSAGHMGIWAEERPGLAVTCPCWCHSLGPVWKGLLQPSATPGTPRRTGLDWPPAEHGGGATCRAQLPGPGLHFLQSVWQGEPWAQWVLAAAALPTQYARAGAGWAQGM